MKMNLSALILGAVLGATLLSPTTGFACQQPKCSSVTVCNNDKHRRCEKVYRCSPGTCRSSSSSALSDILEGVKFGTSSFANLETQLSGTCSLDSEKESKTVSFESDDLEKIALGFRGNSGSLSRIEIANNSGRSFDHGSLMQVAVDLDDGLKNPPLLCPVQPEAARIECVRYNDALYPSFEQFSPFDNNDGLAVSNLRENGFRAILKPSDLDSTGTARIAFSTTVDGVEVQCGIGVTTR